MLVLFAAEAPLAAENFRQLATGEAGRVPPGREGAGRFYTFRGASFYRIIPGFIDQSGSNTDSVYGGLFPDDPGGLALKHDRPGRLSVANTGPNENGGHFSILLAAAPHLDGKYVVFGQVLRGMATVRIINALGEEGRDTEPSGKAVIVDCGELHATDDDGAPPAPWREEDDGATGAVRR